MVRWAAFVLLAPMALASDDGCRALVLAGEEAKARDCYFTRANTLIEPASQGDALYQAGRSQMALGDVRGAIGTYERVLELRRRSGQRKEEGVVLNDLGSAHWTLGDMRAGLRLFEDALVVRREVRDVYGEALTLTGMGHIYMAWGEADAALGHYGDALKIFRELKNDRFQGETLNSLGLAYATLGDHAKATRYYNDALVFWRKLKITSREAYTLNNLGLLELDRRAYTAALANFDLALPMLERDVRAQSYVRNNQGEAEAGLKHFDRALELFDASLASKRKLGDEAGEAYTLERQAEALAASGNYADALARFDEALKLHRKVGSRPREAITLGGRARVLRMLGRPAEARESIEEALRLIETLRSQLADRDLRTTFFATQQDYYALYIDLLMSMHEDAAALAANERSRSRVLLDMLREAKMDVQSDVPRELVERKQAAERDLRVMAQRGGAGPKFEAALEAYNNADAAIRKSSPRYAAVVATETLDAAAIGGQVLDAQTVLLEYALGAERSYGWMASVDGVKSAVLPGRSKIDATVRRMLSAITERKPDSDAVVNAAAAALGRMLVGPFAKEIAGKRLLIVPDGSLNYVPFAALRVPGSSMPLVAMHEVTRAPSASIVAALRAQERGVRPSRAVLAVADPVFDKTDPRVLGEAGVSASTGAEFPYTRLRFSRYEADAITAFQPARSRAIVDFDANRDAVLKASLGQYRILHFATHAEIDNEHPALSRIVVSQVDRNGRTRDGAIRLLDIFNLKLNADLVVLSACRSALGKDIRGEGLAGLTRGFFYAGAKGVVASLWDVEDRATAALMKQFYEPMLRRGEPASAALRRAQLAIAADPKWSSPYYWASFTLQGDWLK